MVTIACSQPDCDTPAHGRGLCHRHYQRAWLGRPLDDRLYQYEPRADQCTVEGCDDVPRARNWCSAHYQRWRAYGDPLGGASARREQATA